MTNRKKNEGQSWACGQIEAYVKVFPRYQRYAEVLKEVLEKVAAKHTPLAIVQTRPKSIAGFAQKMFLKKAKGRYADAINRITDLCGGRIVVPTLAEVKAICEFIEGHFDIDWENTVDLSQRLKPAEFGYRGIHYIVKFEPGVFPNKDVNVEIPEEVFGLRAEVQVKTILEHSWGIFTHDRAYKGAFKIPEKWEREMAGLSAVLEGVDASFARIETALRRYAGSYGAYMTEQQIRAEIENLGVILEYDPQNVELAARMGKLALALGDWQKAIDVLKEHVSSGFPPVFRDLGVAMCKLYRDSPACDAYKQGQRYLESAAETSNRDSDALASLAGTWKGIDEEKARELYRRAFEADPSDPYPLGNYLDYEIASRRDVSMVSLISPIMEAAIKRGRDQADVSMNLPWAFYDIGRFNLLLGRPYESLAACAKAVQLSTAEWMIDTSLRSIEKLDMVRDKLPGYEWVRRFLLLGLAAKFPSSQNTERVKKLASSDGGLVPGPVVIVAGGSNGSADKQVQDYRQLMIEAFRYFNGTVMSGGTTVGVSGMVGEIGEKYRNTIKTIGYIPGSLPAGGVEDGRYAEIRRTAGDSFSPLEAIQCWTDIIASGISPAQVRLLGISGGNITAAEYRIALSLGASVAVFESSGGEAARLATDSDWASSKVVRLPNDAITIGTFVEVSTPKLDPNIRQTIARAIHENYRDVKAKSVRSEDPAMAEWDRLTEDLRQSNLQQTDDIIRKLQRIGCTVQRVTGRKVARMTFTRDEIEIMAKIEHARWNAERLLAGWTQGEKRDAIKKTSPYLVGWAELPEDIKEWDRETVRKIPDFLAGVDLEIRRQ